MMLSQFYTILPLLVSLALAGDLNVKRDMSVAATEGYKDGQYVWTSILDLEKKEKATDEEMVKMCTMEARRCGRAGTTQSRRTSSPRS